MTYLVPDPSFSTKDGALFWWAGRRIWKGEITALDDVVLSSDDSEDDDEFDLNRLRLPFEWLKFDLDWLIFDCRCVLGVSSQADSKFEVYWASSLFLMAFS